jgi:hypothetical protein
MDKIRTPDVKPPQHLVLKAKPFEVQGVGQLLPREHMDGPQPAERLLRMPRNQPAFGGQFP